jgi:hypothetical protein
MIAAAMTRHALMPKKRTISKSRQRDLNKVLAALQEQLERERAAFRKVVDSLRSSAPLLRAEGCLRFWAEQLAEWGDHEAVVYLASRGNDPAAITRTILTNWREAEKEAISRMRAIAPPGDSHAANAFKEDPIKFLIRFWSFFDSQELSIDATMLRTVEWCSIRGFEQWWQKLGNELREGAFSGGAHPFAIFNYCRADYVVRRMRDGLQLSLDALETLGFPKSTPWWRTDGLECAIHDAAAIIFAHARLGTTLDSLQLVERATDDLRRFFNHRVGAWPAFSGQPEKLSIESTAMALHALRLRSVDDWEHFAGPAQTWLWAQQHPDGYWFENAAPDPVWLTVLVLDAIELASGRTNVTFRLEAPTSGVPLVFVAYQHDDTQWLEELKRHLGALVHSGRIEFFDDRQIGGGKEWDPHIREKLMAARIIVPLISPNFLGSKYIQTVEFPTAIARHKEGTVTVLPVLIEECDWRGLRSQGVSLDQINMLPKDAKNNLKAVRAWGRKKHEALTQGGCPRFC